MPGTNRYGWVSHRDKGALLSDVIPKYSLERRLQQVGGGVIAPGPPSQPLIHAGTHLHHQPFRSCFAVQRLTVHEVVLTHASVNSLRAGEKVSKYLPG